MPEKEKLKKFKAEEETVRQILNDWEPIEGSPEDEYDCLVHRLISTLHKGEETTKSISSLISNELKQHFGVEIPDEEIDTVSKEIIGWWFSRTGNR